MLLDLVHPDDVDRAVALCERMLASPGEEVRNVVRVRAADGSWADLELVLVNALDDPDLRSVVAATRNVTAQRRQARELALARDAAVSQAEARTRLLAAVSHELRTPLHTVLGMTEALRSTTLDEHQRAMVEAAHHEGVALRHLVDDLLDLSRIEAGELRLEPSPTDPRALVEQALADAGVVAPVVVDAAVPALVAVDAVRLAQVVVAMLGLAQQIAGPAGLEVALGRRASLRPGLEVRVAVPGAALTAEEERLLFEPLGSSLGGGGGRDAGGSDRLGGRGLELALAHRLALLMGGTLGVERPAGGVAVVLTASAASTERRAEPDERRTSAAGGRVLVVDDSATNRLLAASQLEHLGYEPLVAESGEAALDLLATTPVDAVLMDWQLPGIDGLEATRRVRAAAAPGTHLPVLAVTASVRPGDEERCLAAGMDALLAKPVLLDDLDRAMRRALAAGGGPARRPTRCRASRSRARRRWSTPTSSPAPRTTSAIATSSCGSSGSSGRSSSPGASSS